MHQIFSILIVLLICATPGWSQQAGLPHNPNTGEVPGDLTFTGNNTFTQSVTLGSVTVWPGADGIETLTVNGTAAALYSAGAVIHLPNGIPIGVIYDGGHYFWSDEIDDFGTWGRDVTAWSTAEEGAARLRTWLAAQYWTDVNGNGLSPQPTFSGSGAQVIITRESAPVLGLRTTSSTLLPVAITQNGTAGGWIGTPKFLRLLNSDNNKLYELKITGSPNPVLTISEVAP